LNHKRGVDMEDKNVTFVIFDMPMNLRDEIKGIAVDKHLSTNTLTIRILEKYVRDERKE